MNSIMNVLLICEFMKCVISDILNSQNGLVGKLNFIRINLII